MLTKTISIIVWLLLWASPAWSTIYWVDNDGAADHAACVGSTPLSGAAACPITEMTHINAAVGHGDTVYFREGAYSIGVNGRVIIPTASGELGSVITYSGYGDEVVTITATSDSAYAVYLAHYAAGVWTGNDYIKITKLNFVNFATAINLKKSSYNEISYCTIGPQRDAWADVKGSGKVKTADPTGATLTYDITDTGATYSAISAIQIINTTDHSGCFSSGAPTCGDTECTRTCFASYYPNGLEFGDDNTFTKDDDYIIVPAYTTHFGIFVETTCTHNWIHHNTLHSFGALTRADEGIVMELGGTGASSDDSNYNTIEYNEMYAGGHHVLGVNGCKYCVIRGNYVHNEAWWDDSAYFSNGCSKFTENDQTGNPSGKCGYRVISNTTASGTGGYSLWEGNFVGYGAAYGGPHLNPGGGAGGGTTLSSASNIYRYNDHFYNSMYGLRTAASISGSNNNRVYNNTFYKNGYGADDDEYAYVTHRGGVTLYDTDVTGTVIKNNLFYDQWSETHFPNSLCTAPDVPFDCCTGNGTGTGGICSSNYAPAIYAINSTVYNNNTFDTNYADTSSYFMRGTTFNLLTDPFAATPDITATTGDLVFPKTGVNAFKLLKPVFTLNTAVPTSAVNGGIHLTTVHASDSGTGVTLYVADASYFQDGTWGSDLARSGLEADWICIESTAKCQQIDSATPINYTTNVITLKGSLDRSVDDRVFLYKKSNEDIVFVGAAPDQGAHESDQEGAPPNHTVTVALTGTGGTVSSTGANVVAEGDFLNVTTSTYSGWTGAWSTTDAVGCPVSGCTPAAEGSSGTCTITPTGVGSVICTVRYTVSPIQIW